MKRSMPTRCFELSEETFATIPAKEPFAIMTSWPICICEATGFIFDASSAICMASISSSEMQGILSPNFIISPTPFSYILELSNFQDWY